VSEGLATWQHALSCDTSGRGQVMKCRHFVALPVTEDAPEMLINIQHWHCNLLGPCCGRWHYRYYQNEHGFDETGFLGTWMVLFIHLLNQFGLICPCISFIVVMFQVEVSSGIYVPLLLLGKVVWDSEWCIFPHSDDVFNDVMNCEIAHFNFHNYVVIACPWLAVTVWAAPAQAGWELSCMFIILHQYPNPSKCSHSSCNSLI
jgi:hypothetical protein